MAITFFFFLGGAFATLIRLELMTPEGDLVHGGDLQQAVLDARHHHGLFLPDPVHSHRARKFSDPDDDRRAGSGFSPLESVELVLCWSSAAYLRLVCDRRRRRRYGMDVLHALQQPVHAIRTSLLRWSGIFIAGFSSILTGLNFIVTIHKMRAPGMTWFRLPLFIWSHLCDGDHSWCWARRSSPSRWCLLRSSGSGGVGIFDPTLGGDPILFQHLFWFYSHPAVYIMILPGMGVVSELVTTHARASDFRLQLRRVFEYCDRGHRISGVGPPHVCGGPVAVREHDFFGR